MTKTVRSIRDVARETGLSIATISRVMNGVGRVSPETRARVLSACDKLDYFPNSAARALSTSRSKTVAAIIPTIEHSVFAKYVSGIERSLSERDYSLVVAISNGDPAEELTAARKLIGMGAEAFILSGAAHGKALMELFARRRVPHILSSVWDPDNPSPTIGYDNRQLANDAIGYLAQRGHRHIGVMHGPLAESDRTRLRRAGAEAAATPELTLTFYETNVSVAGAREAVRQMLGQPRRCTALACFSDVLALGAYFGLAEAGLAIPGDISVMGFDNLDWSRDANPPLTTVDLPAELMGREVAGQLMDHLEQGDPLRATLLDCAIVERGSVRELG